MEIILDETFLKWKCACLSQSISDINGLNGGIKIYLIEDV